MSYAKCRKLDAYIHRNTKTSFVYSEMGVLGRRKIPTWWKLVILVTLVYLLLALLFMQKSFLFQKSAERIRLIDGMRAEIKDNDLMLSSTYLARNMNSSKVTLYSNREPNSKYYLTIGIPTVARKLGIDYLIKTLNSLVLDQHNKNGKLEILLVIQLGDSDENTKKKLGEKIEKFYRPLIAAGVIDVIQVPSEYYPSRAKLKKKYGDSEERIKWRSKQVVDFSFLFRYCHGLAKYHVQLEDDVIASPEYFLKLKNFIEEHEGKEIWFTLDASVLGYIGKVYHNHDLEELANFYYLFFDEMPVDWLEYRWREIKGQPTGFWRQRAASLFQHIGVVSSMLNKKQALAEPYFDNHSHKFLGQNPPAKLHTDVIGYRNLKIENAYEKGSGYFWGKCMNEPSCFVKIIFRETIRVKRIAIETGANFALNDTIYFGSLESGTKIQGEDCLQYDNKIPMNFKNGRLDVSFSKELTTNCFKLVIQKQVRWIFLREINVWKT